MLMRSCSVASVIGSALLLQASVQQRRCRRYERHSLSRAPATPSLRCREAAQFPRSPGPEQRWGQGPSSRPGTHPTGLLDGVQGAGLPVPSHLSLQCGGALKLHISLGHNAQRCGYERARARAHCFYNHCSS
eukprot:968429-Pleurochrysis_carterae.AAC.1